MHSGFNVLASLSVILVLLGVTGFAAASASEIALFAAILFAFAAIEHVRAVVATADYPAIQLGSARYRPAGGKRRVPPPGAS